MKFVIVLSLFFSISGWSKTESHCDVVDGFYRNSDVSITNIKFETLADIFSLNNAKTLSFEIAGKEIRFQRTDMDVKKYTKMQFVGVQNLAKTHAALVTIDRSPKEVVKSRDFYASIMTSLPLNEGEANSMLSFNLYCKF